MINNLKSFLFLIMLFCSVEVQPQSFTKITEGNLVNDGGESFGISWADFDNDGYPDLYISNGGADLIDAHNFLYSNNKDGSFTKITNGSIVEDMEKTIGSTIADFNNDGYEDVFTANRDGENNSLFLNNGDLTFTKISSGNIVSNGGNSNGSSWADYDNDGLIDLFVANFFEQGFLYKNDDGNTFTRITTGHPVSEVNTSISCSWGDFDNDGDLDLFIPNAAAAGKQNLFYINNGNGNFTKVTSGGIVTDLRASMGGSWGDYDNDGDIDLFVANQGNFVNDLYINNNNGTFSRLDSGEVVSETSNSISGSWIDFDNDGDLDLFVTNWLNGKNFLYDNSGAPDYYLSKITSGEIVNDEENTMGGAWADFDNDGDLDLFLANRGGQNNAFYRNDSPTNNFVNIKCVGVNSNKSAIGTKIKLKATINGNSFWQIREINSQHGYNSQDDKRVHFGLGNAELIDTIIIEWTSSLTEIFTGVQVNKFYEAIEGSGISLITALDTQSDEIPFSFKLTQNYPNPFNPTTSIKFDVHKQSNIRIEVYDQTGQKINILFDGSKPAGSYKIQWNLNEEKNNLASGIYFLRLVSNNYSQTIKMMYLK